jgi:hypothetical protein
LFPAETGTATVKAIIMKKMIDDIAFIKIMESTLAQEKINESIFCFW